MREYERLRTEGKLSELVTSSSAAKDKLIKDDVTTSSAGDVGSESSISDVQVSAVLEVIWLRQCSSDISGAFYLHEQSG